MHTSTLSPSGKWSKEKEAKKARALATMQAAAAALPTAMDLKALKAACASARKLGVADADVDAAECTLARVAARRRTPMAIQRKAKEALANARKESSRRAGDGPGFFHINGAMKRNNGPRNTAGVRCMQPRSGAF